jgi:hypothetical protein
MQCQSHRRAGSVAVLPPIALPRLPRPAQLPAGGARPAPTPARSPRVTWNPRPLVTLGQGRGLRLRDPKNSGAAAPGLPVSPGPALTVSERCSGGAVAQAEQQQERQQAALAPGPPAHATAPRPSPRAATPRGPAGAQIRRRARGEGSALRLPATRGARGPRGLGGGNAGLAPTPFDAHSSPRAPGARIRTGDPDTKQIMSDTR